MVNNGDNIIFGPDNDDRSIFVHDNSSLRSCHKSTCLVDAKVTTGTEAVFFTIYCKNYKMSHLIWLQWNIVARCLFFFFVFFLSFSYHNNPQFWDR